MTCLCLLRSHFFLYLSGSFIMTEEQIIAGSIKQNHSAQENLYKRFSPKMLGICYRYAKSRPDAEEMLQEGFIRVFSQLYQYQSKGSLEGWIRKVIVHTCINIIKRNKRFNEYLELEAAFGIPDRSASVFSISESKQVIECIRMLPIGYRTVLNLFAIEGYSHREIASMLDIEESSSRSRYLRARQMLEKILNDYGIMERTKNKTVFL